MKTFLSHLLLHVTTGKGVPIEAAALGYLLTEKAVHPGRPDEEPPPGILRRLSAGRVDAPAPDPEPRPPVAQRPPATPRARPTPPRPWA
jgi:hypothetical protein